MGRNTHGGDAHSTADQDKDLRVNHLVKEGSCRIEDGQHDEHAREDIDCIVDADVLLAGAIRPSKVVKVADHVGCNVSPQVAVAIVL